VNDENGNVLELRLSDVLTPRKVFVVSDRLPCSCCSRRRFLGVTLVALFPGWVALADRVHIVKKGETLSGLSRRYGIGLRELAGANGLTTKTKVKIGQKLIVPSSSGGKPKIDAALKSKLQSTSVKRGRWKNIVYHHSATSSGSVKGMDEYHRETRHMENGLAYHFVIGNGKGMPDGQIVAGNRWDKQLAGGHLASESLNRISLGICLVGNFEKSKPTRAQLKSLAALTNYLMARCRLSLGAVKTHQQINTVYTACPGKRFPIKTVKEMLI